MTKDEALKIALDALQQIAHVSAMDYEYQQWAVEAITAIKEALAQPEQEPIGYASEGAAKRLTTVKQAHEQIRNFRLFTHDVPLYTAPQRTWVGLTDEEIVELHHEIKVQLMGTYKTEDIYRAIEAKLKEKNT